MILKLCYRSLIIILYQALKKLFTFEYEIRVCNKINHCQNEVTWFDFPSKFGAFADSRGWVLNFFVVVAAKIARVTYNLLYSIFHFLADFCIDTLEQSFTRYIFHCELTIIDRMLVLIGYNHWVFGWLSPHKRHQWRV